MPNDVDHLISVDATVASIGANPVVAYVIIAVFAGVGVCWC